MHVNGIQFFQHAFFLFPNNVANVTLKLAYFKNKLQNAHGMKNCILFGFEFFEFTKFD
jgi:hypothetical protein